MFILVDDEDRENEGDLVIPAQFATPDAINFMAKHARGLICLAMTRQRVEQLGLPLMSQQNGTRHQTAFTVSIEAREGVTTGISAADRARTVQVLIAPESTHDDLVMPGHLFPLRARDGGVLVRAGQTEATVDLCKLAGLHPAGVLCEIMRYIIVKGPIAVNGVSLTVIDRDDETFSLGLIPYTQENTNLMRLAAGDRVNLESDIIARYVEQLLDERYLGDGGPNDQKGA
jgi:3,4-dihydroxy-2-butanone 4-phosphate synthase